jgi:L-ascorbate metabolism protein UlaG (beta-lactamase superfamily)
MRRLIRWVFIGILLLAVAGLAGIGWLFGTRPGLERYQTHRYPDIATTEGVSAAWFGTTAILLSDGTHDIFIDPFFTRPGGWPSLMLNRPIAPDEQRIAAWLRKAGIERLDAVVVTHSHYDHSMDVGVVAHLTGAVLLGSESTANVARGSALPESQIRIIAPGIPVTFGSFTLTALESRHAGATGGRPLGDITRPLVPPARYTAYRQGGTFSILVEHPLGTALHHGSAGWLPDMYRNRRADLVFLGIAAAPPLEQYLAQVTDVLRATRVIPTHWDDFTRPLDAPLKPLPFGVDLNGFFEDAQRLRPELKVLTLEPGRRVMLFTPPQALPADGT